MTYKCPKCGAIDNYKWIGNDEHCPDDECECKKCGEVFAACNNRLNEKKVEAK